MEIKVAPVPTSIRFPVQAEVPPSPASNTGVSWMYVALLCGGCILVTVLIYEAKKQRKLSETPSPTDEKNRNYFNP